MLEMTEIDIIGNLLAC